MFDAAIRALETNVSRSSDFDLNPSFKLPKDRLTRPAAVLIVLAPNGADWMVYLTKRSAALKHHPGQIAFPGGKKEPSDATLTDAALREAHEEIGLPADGVRVAGQLPEHETVTGFVVTPIVAALEQNFRPKPDAGEVAEVFTVPLSHVLTPSNFSVQSRRWRGQTRSYYTVPYGPYFIWGATARILRGWAETVQVM